MHVVLFFQSAVPVPVDAAAGSVGTVSLFNQPTGECPLGQATVPAGEPGNSYIPWDGATMLIGPTDEQ